MSDAFDPFNLSDDDFEVDGAVNISQMSVNRSAQSNDSSFNISFDSSFQQDVPVQPPPHQRTFGRYSPTTNVNKNSSSLDSDIFSQLFASPSRGAKGDLHTTNSSPVSRVNTSFSKLANFLPASSFNRNEITVNIALHEEMSCIYDSTPNSTPIMDIKGTINIKPTANIEGRTFYISLKDPHKHMKQVTSFFEIAKEITDHLKEEDPFVKKHQKDGNRIFKVDIPENIDSLGSKPFNVIKYTGSEFLRPIPLVSSCFISHYNKLADMHAPNQLSAFFINPSTAC